MKDVPFVQRFRSGPAVAKPASDAPHPLRLWMTGSLAVVMAALVPARDVADRERADDSRVARHSRFGVVETVQRIEAEARSTGLSVLARISGQRPVIVLGSSVGGTLIVMNDAHSRPDVPLSVQVRAGDDGGADVFIAAAHPAEWEELPRAVMDDLVALPKLVERALA